MIYCLKQCKYNAFEKYYAIRRRYFYDTVHREFEILML